MRLEADEVEAIAAAIAPRVAALLLAELAGAQRKVAWTDVLIGASVTSLLFTIGKSLIGVYIGRSGVTSGFGAAGSLVMAMIWVYYSAQIFLLGAEFTWAYALTFGSRKEQQLPGAAPAVPSKTANKNADPNMVEAKEAAIYCEAEDAAAKEQS